MEVRRSPDLEALVAEARSAQDRGDDEWFPAHAARGDVVIAGTAPGEIIRGHDTVFSPRYSLRAMTEELAAIGVHIENGDFEAYEAGDAGFAISNGAFAFEDGAHVPTRTVTVFTRADGKWLTIGSFISIVAADELVTKDSPLTTAAPAATR
jgi:SnoaL-like domain